MQIKNRPKKEVTGSDFEPSSFNPNDPRQFPKLNPSKKYKNQTKLTTIYILKNPRLLNIFILLIPSQFLYVSLKQNLRRSLQ